MDMEKNQALNEIQYANILEPIPEKPLFEIGQGDTAFSICAVVFSVFSAVFGIFGGYALGYAISCLLMMGLFTFYFAKSGTVKPLPLFCGILAVANSAVFVCTSNGSVRFFSAVVSFLMGLVFFDGHVNGSAKGNRETFGIFYTALATIGNLFRVIKSLFTGKDGDKKVIGKVFIGLACAIPVLLVVVPLLISSDDAFRGMIGDIFKDSAGNIFKAIFGAILSVFAISYGISIKKGDITRIKKGEFSGIENAYIISFLSAIGFCYLLYLFSQLAYFFSAFKGFLPDGEITYAQYARKGFFEMCVIAVINLIIVFLALFLAKKKNGKACGAIKILATFIAVFTLIIIATAVSKMVLYIGTFGMTILRLTTSAFMVFLAVVFISVILRIFSTKINIVKTALITASCILTVLGTANVNEVCARYNYESYMTKKLDKIDVSAMNELSDEGIPYLVKLATGEDKEVSKEARLYLADAVYYDYFEALEKDSSAADASITITQKHKGFERFSLPRQKALDSLCELIENDRDFYYQCKGLFNDNKYIW
ncbi:MAG: DUF4173 domain-containing protein [Ruminococcaceae bacterium]|nr:DUF4173 domain-containing protein [Oscillospiraceae bacterium]